MFEYEKMAGHIVKTIKCGDMTKEKFDCLVNQISNFTTENPEDDVEKLKGKLKQVLFDELVYWGGFDENSEKFDWKVLGMDFSTLKNTTQKHTI